MIALLVSVLLIVIGWCDTCSDRTPMSVVVNSIKLRNSTVDGFRLWMVCVP